MTKAVVSRPTTSWAAFLARRVGDWRFDIGGHRFFTKVTPVRELWHEMLPDEDFLLRPRMSRIFYRGRFYDYPLRAFNALRNLGVLEAVRCVLSYLWVRIRPPKDLTTFEGYIASKFGWRLYGIFFKTYTEKVWGVPADQIQADWAAQRVKNLDLLRAIINSLAPPEPEGDHQPHRGIRVSPSWSRDDVGTVSRTRRRAGWRGPLSPRGFPYRARERRRDRRDRRDTDRRGAFPVRERCVVDADPPPRAGDGSLLPRRRFLLLPTGWHSAISSRLRSSCPKQPGSLTTGSISMPLTSRLAGSRTSGAGRLRWFRIGKTCLGSNISCRRRRTLDVER